MVLNPSVPVIGSPLVIVNILVARNAGRIAVRIQSALVLAPEERIRRSQLEGEGDVRTLARINLLVGGCPRETQCIAQVMRDSGVEDEVVGVPVVEPVGLPAELVVEDEVVVRPLEPVSETHGKSVNLELPVIIEDIPCEVRVGLTAVIS